MKKKKKKQLQKHERIQKLKATLGTGVSINNWMFSRVDRSKNVETKRPPGTWLTNPSHIAFQRKTSRNTEARHPSSHTSKPPSPYSKKKKKKNILIETFSLRIFLLTYRFHNLLSLFIKKLQIFFPQFFKWNATIIFIITISKIKYNKIKYFHN